MPSTETGQPRESASAATSARCFGVPRSTGAAASETSIGPSTDTSTAAA